jgi:hypothetical protein
LIVKSIVKRMHLNPIARLTGASLGVLTLALAAFAVPVRAADVPNCSTVSTAATCPAANGVTGIYGIEARTLAAQMAAHPTPDLTPVPINERELYSRAYRRVMTATDVYDGPNGNVIAHIDNGFSFVNAGIVQNGWVEIRPGQWLPDKTLGVVNKAISKFSGVALPNGFPSITFAWMLLDTKPSRTPGGLPPSGTALIKRYALVNLFASETVDGWQWYLIGPDQWVLQTRVAIAHPVARPDGITGKWVAVDLYEQTLIAYEDDKPVFATLISSGLPLSPTAEGTFKIYDRHELIKMSGAGGQPDFYYLPEVPYVMYFNDAQQALHGAYWHDGFGFRHSHGCVNMSITDAEWTFNWTADQPSATVYVYHSGDYKPTAS